MSTPPFSFPFAHWTSTPLGTPTASLVLGSTLVLGLTTGELLIVSTHAQPQLRARLLGHRSRIIALHSFTSISERSSTELQFLSLSADGEISKWSAQDYRCLQSASTGIKRAVGMVVAERCGIGEGRLTDSLIMVYARKTEVVVLNAESLEVVLVWSGLQDWGLPVVLGKVGERECEVAMVMAGGEVTSWVLEGQPKDLGSTEVLRVKKGSNRWKIVMQEEWGMIKGAWRMADDRWIIAQSRGVGIYTLEGDELSRCDEQELEHGCAKLIVSEDAQRALLVDEIGNIKILDIRSGKFNRIAEIRPATIEDHCVVDVAVNLGSDGFGKLIVSSRPLIHAHGPRCVEGHNYGTELTIAHFTIVDNSMTDLKWQEKGLSRSNHLRSAITPSSCSAIFQNLLCTVHGPTLYFHTLPTFLISYHEPTSTLDLPLSPGDAVSILRSIPLQSHVYLIAGTSSGSIFILSSPTSSPRHLALSPGSITGLYLLPATLGRRIRATLLAVDEHGTAIVVDIERNRIMTTLPSHGNSTLFSVAMKIGQNLLALTYSDGVRREWSLDEGAGELVNPGSRNEESLLLLDGEWMTTLMGSEATDEEEYESSAVNTEHGKSLDICAGFPELGFPSAKINVRSVLAELLEVTKIARENRRPQERKVNAINPALVRAKALLTALVPDGVEHLIPTSDDDGDKAWGEEDEEDELRQAVEGCFIRRARVPTLGQIGAGGRITMISPDTAAEEGELSETVTGILVLAVILLVQVILAALGKDDDLVANAVDRIIVTWMSREKVTLGIFAKFWGDSHPLIQSTARRLLSAGMAQLTDDDRSSIAVYWQDFLPFNIPPPLATLKEVPRSVMILTTLLHLFPATTPATLTKHLSQSTLLLLTHPPTSSIAAEIVSFAWPTLESHADPLSLLTTLLSLPAEPTITSALLSISRQNTPLVVSTFLSLLSVPSQQLTDPITTAGVPPQARARAVQILTTIINTDPILLIDLLPTIIDTLVKFPLHDLLVTLAKAYPTIAYHPTSGRVAYSGRDGAIIVMDLKQQGLVVHDLMGHRGRAEWVIFSSDGRWVAAVAPMEGAEGVRPGTGVRRVSNSSIGVRPGTAESMRKGNSSQGQGHRTVDLPVGLTRQKTNDPPFSSSSHPPPLTRPKTGDKSDQTVSVWELCAWRFPSGLLSFIGTATTGEKDTVVKVRGRWKVPGILVVRKVEWKAVGAEAPVGQGHGGGERIVVVKGAGMERWECNVHS